jgi:hypothetical protein
MEIKCKFKSQQDIIERSNFKTRKVWVITEDNPDYPQTIEVEVTQEKVDIFSQFRQGQPITAHINIRGREWTNTHGEVKVFNTLQVWKIEAVTLPAQEFATPKKKEKQVFTDSDLPF